jgi:solute carrier family 13 (sodium-dependent dicarboxylate transporter), member 2/3/5
MRRAFPLAGGPALLLLTIAVPPPGDLTALAWRVAGVAAWMAVWWLTAVIPLEATALLPIVFLPLVGAGSITAVTAPYADPIIFLFLVGFLMAATLERWELHTRFALATVRIAGTAGPRVILAFMVASAALSMWISNTATAVMMLPIAMAVTTGIESGAAEERERFATALLLGVAYACSIGGVATLIGTPPNAILAGAARELLDRDVGFGNWMVVGVGTALPLLLLCWLMLLRVFRVRGDIPGLAGVVAARSAQLDPMSGAERFILTVFGLTAAAWIFREPKTIGSVVLPGLSTWLPAISDTGIAIGAAMVLFVVPLRGARYAVALDWRSASKVPWGILLLFGGGLSLAKAFEISGLTEWIAGSLGTLRGAPILVIILATVTLFVFLTELTSNSATAALGMPLMVGVAGGLDVPAFPLMVAAALASSMAFMLPVATPPNAIVFGSGMLRARDMARAGMRLNLVAIVVITLGVWLWT